MGALTNHLWQSTLFTVLVAGATLALKRNQAKTRYWLWLAASIKFLIPFSLLVTLGSQVDLPTTTPTLPPVAVEQITTSFAPVSPLFTSAPRESKPWWPTVMTVAWFIGSIVLLIRWFHRWLLIHAALRGASRLPIAAPIPVLSSHTAIGPGVFGIVRPVLLLPEGITNNLRPEELDAILAHELSHVRRRDNLTAALHMLVETLFWFHPLVWWIGSKLVEERERACDEAVLREGSQPEIYAQSVLNVCKYYLESPLPCASGVTGADLKKANRGNHDATHLIPAYLDPQASPRDGRTCRCRRPRFHRRPQCAIEVRAVDL
jgi:bla regulator protein blaR1